MVVAFGIAACPAASWLSELADELGEGENGGSCREAEHNGAGAVPYCKAAAPYQQKCTHAGKTACKRGGNKRGAQAQKKRNAEGTCGTRRKFFPTYTKPV